MAHWNWLDWVLATIVIASVLTAIWKGFVAELVALASLIVGLIIAAVGYERLAPLLGSITRSHEVALAVSFLLLFVGTLLVGAVVSAIARKLIRKAELQWFDRFLGGAFGLVRGLLFDCILLLVLMAFAIEQKAVQKSVLAPYITAGSRVIALAMPGEMRNDFRTGFEKFRKTLIQSDKKAMGFQSTADKEL
ncbi:MAG: CvpA family protein [Acidobacteriota bacterium]